MASGPQHYTEAEQYLRLADDVHRDSETQATYYLAVAQVHATLAQAAATFEALRINPAGWTDALAPDNT